MLNVAAAAPFSTTYHITGLPHNLSCFQTNSMTHDVGHGVFLLAAYEGQGQTCSLPVARIHG